MCDPITALLGVVGMGASLLGGSKAKAPPPPQVAVPIAQQKIDAPVIKTGSPDDPMASLNTTGATNQASIRKAGTSVGGLGRSGLSLDL